MNLGFRVFDLIIDRHDTDLCCCPECKHLVEPATCAFNNCRWSFVGTKLVDGRAQHVMGAERGAGNHYERFKSDHHHHQER